MKKITGSIVCSVGLIVAFFLPWFDVGIASVNAFDIPRGLALLGSYFGSNVLDFTYALYLIPICAIINTIRYFSGNTRIHHIEFILGLITVIAFLVLASTASNKAYETSGSNVNFTTFFGSGYFLTAVFSFVGIFFFTSKNEEEQEDEPTTQKKEIGAPIHKTQAKQETQVSEDKTTLYNQLEHILRLKQNELISEEQFEKEKQQIHEKLFGIEKKEVEKKPVVVPIADATPKVVAEPIKTVPKRIPIEPEENPNKPLYIVFGISLGLMACVIYYLMPYDKANDTNINNVENTISSYELNGKLCYPSDYIPSMVVYLKEINTNQTYTLATKQNQKQFSFANIPLGNYFAYAYTVDKAHGGYTNAVPCGLSYECQDHSLINIELKGQPFHDTISICDWYGAIVPPEK